MHSDIQKTQPDWCQPWHHEPEATGNGVATCLPRPSWMVPLVQINTSIKLTDGDRPHLQTGLTSISWKDVFLIQVALAKHLRSRNMGFWFRWWMASVLWQPTTWISIEVAKWETTVLQAHNAFDGSDRRKAETCWSQQPTLSSHSASAASVLPIVRLLSLCSVSKATTCSSLAPFVLFTTGRNCALFHLIF